MMTTKLRIVLLLTMLIALISSCNSSGDVAGGSSDTEIVGHLFFCDSSQSDISKRHIPLSGAVVSLVSTSGHPTAGDTLPLDTTDVAGRYRFSEVSNGEYHIFYEQVDSGLSGVVEVVVDTEEPVVIDNQFAEKSGALAVTLTVDAQKHGGRLIIEQTPLVLDFDAGESVVIFPNVPANTLLKVHSYTPGGESFHYPGLFTVSPEDTAAVYYNANVLYLVDTANGAAISQALADSLQSAQLTITVLSIGDFTQEDTSGVDVIYMAAEVDTLNEFADFFKGVNIPLFVSSSELYPLLGMTTMNDFGQETVSNMLLQALSFSPILDTMQVANSISLYEFAALTPIVEWGIASQASSVALSSGVDPSRAYLIHYAEEQILADSTVAVSGRVGFFGSTNGNLNDLGREFVARTLLFLAEYNQVL